MSGWKREVAFWLAVVAAYLGATFAMTAVLEAMHALTIPWGLITGGTIGAVLGLIIIRHNKKRSSHGRYRKAAKAHRAGARGSTGDSTGGAAGTGAGTGASMNPFDHKLDAILRNYAYGINPGPNTSQAGSSTSANPTPPAKRAGDFDGMQFAAGTVTGSRAFDVDKMGRLTGIHYKSVWTPGENEARCMDNLTSYSMFSYETTTGVSPRPPHAMESCRHGFYGYYEGSNDYYAPGKIMGVIEGYGETIIGTRGFRCAKAKIVALHIPDDIPAGIRKLILRNYPDIPTFDSFEAMVAEVKPDDGGMGVSPDTDPDFWTRSAA